MSTVTKPAKNLCASGTDAEYPLKSIVDLNELIFYKICRAQQAEKPLLLIGIRQPYDWDTAFERQEL